MEQILQALQHLLSAEFGKLFSTEQLWLVRTMVTGDWSHRGAHPASLLEGHEAKKGRTVTLNIPVYLFSEVRNSWSCTSAPSCVFVTCCLIKLRDRVAKLLCGVMTGLMTVGRLAR
jgi:hypothetical protein